MKISVVQFSQIESCHRLGVKDGPGRFCSDFPICKSFLELGRFNNIKGTNNNKGCLTKSRQEIFIAAHKHFGLRLCWTVDGGIIILLPINTK